MDADFAVVDVQGDVEEVDLASAQLRADEDTAAAVLAAFEEHVAIEGLDMEAQLEVAFGAEPPPVPAPPTGAAGPAGGAVQPDERAPAGAPRGALPTEVPPPDSGADSLMALAAASGVMGGVHSTTESRAALIH